MPAPRLNTTSYAVLALLAVRPWTTYELAQQMKRSVRDVWPRAESVIYEEPKRLAAQGLVKSRTQYTGRRASTVFSITAWGRRALQGWLAIPGAGPVTEFEALLQVAFADLGTHPQLIATLERISRMAQDRSEQVSSRLAEYAETGGPFPDRLPVIALVARYHAAHARMLQDWAEWALAEAETWAGVTPATGARVPQEAFRRAGSRRRRRSRG